MDGVVAPPMSVDWPTLLPEPAWDGSEQLAPFAHRARAISLAPAGAARASAYFALGEALRVSPSPADGARLLDAAAYCYIAAHVHRPDAAAYVNLGVVLQRAGRAREAEAALHLAIHHRPNHGAETAAAYYNLALLPSSQGQTRADMLHKALHFDPEHGPSYLAVGSDLRRAGRLSEALPRLASAASLLPQTAAASHAYGEALSHSGRSEEAIPLLRRAAELAPTHAPHHFVLGQAWMRSYRMHEAASAFSRAYALQPTHALLTARRDDSKLGPEAMVTAAEESARRWAALDEASEDLGSEHQTAGGECDAGDTVTDKPEDEMAVELEWIDEATDAPASHEDAAAVGRCSVVDTHGSAEVTANALAMHASSGLPVLLLNASARWAYNEAGAIDRVLSGELAAESAERGSPLVPVSLVFDDRRTNRIVPMADLVAGRLPPSWRVDSHAVRRLSDMLETHGLHGVLQRAPRHYMRASTLVRLLRNASASTSDSSLLARLYAKQVDLPLHLPAMLRLLDPPLLRWSTDAQEQGSDGSALPLQEANLWLGHEQTLSDLHFDRRPNVLAVLSGRRRVLMVPPEVSSRRLRPTSLIDVQTRVEGDVAAVVARDQPESEAVLLPETWPSAAVDTNHFMARASDLRNELRPTRSGDTTNAEPPVCSFVVRAGDAIFIPPGWAHAVETAAGRQVQPFAAAGNFFYAKPPTP